LKVFLRPGLSFVAMLVHGSVHLSAKYF